MTQTDYVNHYIEEYCSSFIIHVWMSNCLERELLFKKLIFVVLVVALQNSMWLLLHNRFSFFIIPSFFFFYYIEEKNEKILRFLIRFVVFFPFSTSIFVSFLFQFIFIKWEKVFQVILSFWHFKHIQKILKNCCFLMFEKFLNFLNEISLKSTIFFSSLSISSRLCFFFKN